MENLRSPLKKKQWKEFLQDWSELPEEQQEQFLQLQRFLDNVPRVPPNLDYLTPLERQMLAYGTYFLRMEEILHDDNLESIPFHQLADLNVPRTVFLRDRQNRNFHLLEDYDATVTHHNDDALAISSRSGTSHDTNDLNRLYPCDVFGQPAEFDVDVAHLVPKGQDHSYEWMDVSNWALGFDCDGSSVDDWRLSLRLLRGVQAPDNGPRTQLTGLVHSRYNRLRLTQQMYALDGDTPYVMFLPIMTIQECLEWRGGAYSAIVLVATAPGAGREGNNFSSIGLRDTEELHAVRRGTTQELQTALTLLRSCVIRMVQSSQEEGPAEVPENTPDVQAINNARKQRKFRQERLQDGISNSINVPKENATIDLDQRNRGILKIEFSSSHPQAGENENLHPAPDPLLLVARSSVVWSVRGNNWRLRTSVEPQDSDSDFSDEILLPPSWMTNEKEPSEKRFDSVRHDPILERNFVVEF